MATGREILVVHEIEGEINLLLTEGGGVKSVVAEMIMEMIGDPEILEVETQGVLLDPQAVDRTMTTVGMKDEKEIQGKRNVKTAVARIILQEIQNVHRDKNSASSVNHLIMTMITVTIARMHLLVNSVEVILTTHRRIAHGGNRINSEKKRMISDVQVKKER